MIRNHEVRRERRVIAENNTGSFYKFVNQRLSCKSGIGALRDSSGRLVTDDKQRADILNSFFSSVGSQDDGYLPDMKPRVGNGVNFNHVYFSSAVLRAINKLKPNMAAGPDGIPPLLFKRLNACLAEPLSLMYNSFFSIHQIPSMWSKAIITPVFKAGSSSDAANYRPISLTCVACKIMERVVVAQILEYLREHNLISKHQHGFLSRHSTVTNLLESVNDWTLALNDSKGVVIAYIDYAKAFDVVCHKKLIHKLSAYGISGDLNEWISSFLTGRSHCTRVNQSCSDYVNIHSGVIQGSVLGPLLFLLYVNDVTDLFDESCKCKLYADDIKLYSVVDNLCDYRVIQRKLSELQQWSDKWQLKISYKKCSVLALSNQRSRPRIELVMGSVALPEVEVVKDLGVIVDNHLKFDAHVHHIVARAHRLANLIHKCFVSKDVYTLMRAFTTYVRPLLEYASCVWSPCYIGLVTKIESVQRRFTKRFLCCSNLTYSERLAKLNIDRLETRRLHSDLICVYKSMTGMSAVDVGLSDLFTAGSAVTRGHRFKLLIPHTRINIRKYFFSNRVIQCWNSLPAELEDFLTLGSFRQLLRRTDFSNFLIGAK